MWPKRTRPCLTTLCALGSRRSLAVALLRLVRAPRLRRRSLATGLQTGYQTRPNSTAGAGVWCIAVVALTSLAACGDGRTTDIHGYYEWMNDPANGCVRTSDINGVRIEMKYLAPAYLQYQRRDGDDQGTQGNDSTVCFLMSIAPSDTSGGDIMTHGVVSEGAFTARAMNLNFEIRDMLSIRYGGKEYPVLLTTLENVYGLSKKRDVMLVFPRIPPYWSEKADVDIVFDDRIFGTGINHFTFRIRDLHLVPNSIHS
jgi:hypothetical protein